MNNSTNNDIETNIELINHALNAGKKALELREKQLNEANALVAQGGDSRPSATTDLMQSLVFQVQQDLEAVDQAIEANQELLREFSAIEAPKEKKQDRQPTRPDVSF